MAAKYIQASFIDEVLPWHVLLVTLRSQTSLTTAGLIALTTLLYSTPIRSTGVGWAMGLGRLGSFVGPLAIGLLVNRGWRAGDSFVALGVLALCAALFTSLIGIHRPRSAAEADRAATATRPS